MEQLYETCAAQPDKLAVEIRGEPNAEAITYSDLLKRTAQTATWLVSRGVEPGDRVAVCLPKSAAGLQLHLAACSMGAVSMPLNPSYSAAELEYLLLDSEARVLVAPDGPKWDQTATKLIHSVPAGVERIDPSDFATKLPETGLDLSLKRFSADQTALILYTSGTTGRPKGACMSHASLTANMNMLGQAWGWRDDDVLLHVLPLFHVHGLLVALHGSLHAGATCIMHSKFEAKETLNELRNGDCTVFMGVPTIYRRLLAAAGSRDCDFRHMRLMTSGSDRLPIDAFEQIVERFGVRVVERYGMTETGIMTSNPLDGDRIPGQVGLLVALHGSLQRVLERPGSGATCIMHSKFEAKETLNELRNGDCTVFMGVPTIYRRLLAAAGSRDCDFRHMRLMTSGSDRLPIDAFEQIVERFGVRVVERYGMTETGIMTSNPLDGDRIPGQVGPPLPGVEMRVVDPATGSTCRLGKLANSRLGASTCSAGIGETR